MIDQDPDRLRIPDGRMRMVRPEGVTAEPETPEYYEQCREAYQRHKIGETDEGYDIVLMPCIDVATGEREVVEFTIQHIKLESRTCSRCGRATVFLHLCNDGKILPMTRILYEEPETQTQGDLTPPTPPQRTAVATDEPEKRRCRYCNHTQADHMGPRCRGLSAMQTQCICTVFAPKEK